MTQPDHKFCVAPMMTHTDRHFRYFLRLISPHVMLYTEMVTTATLIHGETKKYLAFDSSEHPLAIQLGGSVLEELKHCAILAEDAGFDEINLNVGCPSSRVQTGRIGACLMKEPELVAEGIAGMKAQVAIPVTVKTRIGIDDQDSYEDLSNFIHTVEEAGCHSFIIHARKAWLQGLSPRQNRDIPPLKYETVHRIKQDYPELEIIINGGFNTMEQIEEQYGHVDGVMVGRAICNNPYLLAKANKVIFADTTPNPSRNEILERYTEYVENELSQGTNFSHMTRHILGIFQGQAGARAYRRYLSENIHKPESGIEVIQQAKELIKAA